MKTIKEYFSLSNEKISSIDDYINEKLKLSNVKHDNYNYHPQTKDELKYLMNKLIEERGNEGDFNDIGTSEITDMSDLFYNMMKFNGDISEWDVSNVTDMSWMFGGCKSFNRPLNDWDVSKVTNMKSMFYCCDSFNQPLNKWDVDNVNNIDSIFNGCPIEETNKPKFR